MNDLDSLIEQALSPPRPIEPSAFFGARVMRAVRADAALPPLPFPWLRVSVAAALLGVMIAGALAG